MITLEHIVTKKRLVKTNKQAESILSSSLGYKYKVVESDKQPDPPEVKVSIKKPKEK